MDACFSTDRSIPIGIPDLERRRVAANLDRSIPVRDFHPSNPEEVPPPLHDGRNGKIGAVRIWPGSVALYFLRYPVESLESSTRLASLSRERIL